MGYYIAAVLLIGSLNWAAERLGSARAKMFIFLSTAGAPIFFWAGLTAFFLFRDGVSTFRDPYFLVLLMMVAGATIATAAAALLGRALAARILKGGS